MTSTIEWQVGTPTEFGYYLTIRQERRLGTKRVSINQYATDSVCKSPLPKSCPQGWQMQHPDNSDIVAWMKVDDIEINDN